MEEFSGDRFFGNVDLIRDTMLALLSEEDRFLVARVVAFLSQAGRIAARHHLRLLYRRFRGPSPYTYPLSVSRGMDVLSVTETPEMAVVRSFSTLYFFAKHVSEGRLVGTGWSPLVRHPSLHYETFRERLLVPVRNFDATGGRDDQVALVGHGNRDQLRLSVRVYALNAERTALEIRDFTFNDFDRVQPMQAHWRCEAFVVDGTYNFVFFARVSRTENVAFHLRAARGSRRLTLDHTFRSVASLHLTYLAALNSPVFAVLTNHGSYMGGPGLSVTLVDLNHPYRARPAAAGLLDPRYLSETAFPQNTYWDRLLYKAFGAQARCWALGLDTEERDPEAVFFFTLVYSVVHSHCFLFQMVLAEGSEVELSPTQMAELQRVAGAYPYAAERDFEQMMANRGRPEVLSFLNRYNDVEIRVEHRDGQMHVGTTRSFQQVG